MFGYLVVNKPELKIREFELYQSFYCGLCRELKARGGIAGQLSLTYDLTLVTILLGGLYEPPTRKGTTHCAPHPVTKRTIRKSAATEYAADMNLLLTYYKCRDDWQDEKKLLSAGYAKVLTPAVREIEARYPKKAQVIRELLEEQIRCEREGTRDLDRMAGISGRLLAEVFAWKQDHWEETLRRMGFFLGKFIYLMDAYEDLEKDRKSGSYNLFLELSEKEEFSEQVRQLLTMMMAETCREFEKLPIIKYADLLRNILYSGVWGRYETVTAKRRKESKESKKC